MKTVPALIISMSALLLTAAPALARNAPSLAEVPVVSDSRVKTFVYNENEIFPIYTQYGYQTNIEFGLGEDIQTISVGDRVSWQIIPAGRRLFIQTIQENAHTNLTVVTNRRAYQFDLRSVNGKKTDEDKLVYVARFYYPDEVKRPRAGIQAPDQLVAAPVEDSFNFRYTYTGNADFTPVKVFDDGASTYFQIQGAMPHFFAVDKQGHEHAVNAVSQAGYLVVPSTAKQFVLRSPAGYICVYNEATVTH